MVPSGFGHKISALITKNKTFRDPHSNPYESQAVGFLWRHKMHFVYFCASRGIRTPNDGSEDRYDIHFTMEALNITIITQL